MASNGLFISYTRVSTAKQGVSGLGLDAQREAVSKFIDGPGRVLAGEYQDIESGTRKGNQRPELAKAIAHAKRIKATLIIAKLDRLARNVAFVSNLMESGVDFIAADQPSANKLTIHILAAVAEAEADAISRRTKEALAAAKARGTRLGTPRNLTKEGAERGRAMAKAQAIMEYAHLAPRIVAMRAQGISFGAIGRTLDTEGHKTRTGTTFKDMTLRRIIERVGQPADR
jgi:DNA invertase Pin-like site-specific DNA recombinase